MPSEQEKQINLYNKIFENFSLENTEKQYNSLCKKTINCAQYFQTLVINLFLSLTEALPKSANREKTIELFRKQVDNLGELEIIIFYPKSIIKNQANIVTLGNLLQDMSYSPPIKDPILATLMVVYVLDL